jgi:hypothetical protein
VAIFISILTWTISHGCGVATHHNLEKHRLFKGLGNVEQSGGPLADYRSAQCRSQAVGRGSCNSMSRSSIRPVCDLRSSADSGSGCPGMSTPLSRAVPLHRCRKDRSWLLAREQPGSFARSITSRFRYSTPGIDTLLG